MQTAERSSHTDLSESVIYNRCLFAYHSVADSIKGKVVELGSGEGYGINLLAPNADYYLALDKYPLNPELLNKVDFKQIVFPNLEAIPDNTFDIAISFQVIEHIKDDKMFISQINRILKPQGKAYITTPNKKMSLTRNPWHVREYLGYELKLLFEKNFSSVSIKGVYGNDDVNQYYLKNKEAVRKIKKIDIFDLENRLPAKLLQKPYDILNRLNRRKLLKNETNSVNNITVNSFYLDEYTDKAFDIFIEATK